MNHIFRKEVENLYKKYKEEDSMKENRLDRWRNLEPESALFISIVIRSQQTKHLLEIGTSNGYSTLWFADALKSTNGKLTSIEIEKERTAYASENLKKFGFNTNAELITTDAKSFLAQALPIYDMIFLDAERKYYMEYWPDLKRLITQTNGAILCVDNVISHQHEVSEFTEIIKLDEELINTVINVGAGILLVTKT